MGRGFAQVNALYEERCAQVGIIKARVGGACGHIIFGVYQPTNRANDLLLFKGHLSADSRSVSICTHDAWPPYGSGVATSPSRL